MAETLTQVKTKTCGKFPKKQISSQNGRKAWGLDGLGLEQKPLRLGLCVLVRWSQKGWAIRMLHDYV